MPIQDKVPNLFCTCGKCQIKAVYDGSAWKGYNFLKVANGPCMKKKFPGTSVKDRIRILQIFCPGSGSYQLPEMGSMIGPPTYSQFVADLRKNEFDIKIRPIPLPNKGNVPFDIETGSLTLRSERIFIEARLVSKADNVSFDFLINSGQLAVTTEYHYECLEQMATILQNDIICYRKHGQAVYLVFDFKKKRFKRLSVMPEQVLPLPIFERAYKVAKKKVKDLRIFSRHIVFAE